MAKTPSEGPRVRSLVRELDPACCNLCLVQPNKQINTNKKEATQRRLTAACLKWGQRGRVELGEEAEQVQAQERCAVGNSITHPVCKGETEVHLEF